MADFRSEIHSLTPYTPGEQPPVRSRIIKLNTNENPYPPSPRSKEVVDRILKEGLLRKYPNPSSEKLRTTIANLHGIHPDMVIVTNGSDEAIRLLFTAILRSGSKIAYPDPTYSAYPVFADTTLENISKEIIPLGEDLFFDWKLMKESRADLMAFANPNAPTGILEPRELVIDFLNRFSGFTLVDEAYVDFADDNQGFVGEIANYQNLFVSRTLSKSYSLAGLRLGYLMGDEKWISLLHKIRDSYNVGLLDQEIAIACLEDREYFEFCRNKTRSTRERVKKELESLGFTSTLSAANFLFVKPDPAYSAKSLFNSLRDKEVYVRYFPKGIASDYLRISIGTEEEMDIFLDELKKLL